MVKIGKVLCGSSVFTTSNLWMYVWSFHILFLLNSSSAFSLSFPFLYLLILFFFIFTTSLCQMLRGEKKVELWRLKEFRKKFVEQFFFFFLFQFCLVC